MDELTFSRPPSAAARAAAMRAKMGGIGALGRMVPRIPGGGTSESTYLAALDKFTAATHKWLDNMEQLTESALKQQKKLRGEDPASSDERVHKTPLQKAIIRKSQAEDVVMKDAPVITEIQVRDDSGQSVKSNERIRPSTPTNLPRQEQPIIQPPPPPLPSLPSNPASPPARKFEEMDIQSPLTSNLAEVLNSTDTLTSAALQKPLSSLGAASQESSFTTGFFRPPINTHTSTTSIPSTPPTTLISSPMATPGEMPSIKKETPCVSITPPSEISMTAVPAESSIKSDSPSASSAKKRRLSSRTILDSLMDKKAKNPIWYDGVTQKIFHDLVFEMSQQIQTMKRERRIVMFAKDPACGNLLEKLDNLLQKCLKSIELSSFLFLKGKPDLKEVDTLKNELKSSLGDIAEFKKSGWTMSNDDTDGSDSENDDDDESE